MSANDFYSSGDNSYRQAPQQSQQQQQQQQQQQYYDPNVPEGERGILGATVGSVGGAVATYKYTNGSFWKSAAGAVAGGIALSKIEDEYKARKQNGSNHGNGFNFGSHAAAAGAAAGGGAGGFSNFLGGKRDMDGGSRGVEGYGAPPPYPPSQHHHQQDQYSSGYNSSGSAYPGMNQYAPPPPPPPSGPYGAPGYGAPGYGSPGQGAPHGNGNGYNNW